MVPRGRPSTKIDPIAYIDWSHAHVTGDECKRERKREEEIRGEREARDSPSPLATQAGSKDDEVLVPRPLTVKRAHGGQYGVNTWEIAAVNHRRRQQQRRLRDLDGILAEDRSRVDSSAEFTSRLKSRQICRRGSSKEREREIARVSAFIVRAYDAFAVIVT